MALCATATAAAEVAPPLRAPGLLDCALSLPAPSADDCAVLLASLLRARGVAFDAEHVQVPLAAPPCCPTCVSPLGLDEGPAYHPGRQNSQG